MTLQLINVINNIVTTKVTTKRKRILKIKVMKKIDFLKTIVEEIHSTVMATLDEDGHPVTRVIDVMLYDNEGLYFLTAKGKNFYEQLVNQGYVSLSGMCGGEGTMSKKAVSVSGYVRNIGQNKLDEIFAKNPYMAEIYKSEESRVALTVFQLYKGQGEYFDLSIKPITRANFAIGAEKEKQYGYRINEKCIGCGLCTSKCPQDCIDTSSIPFRIRKNNCLHCGNCMEVCPNNAVEKI